MVANVLVAEDDQAGDLGLDELDEPEGNVPPALLPVSVPVDAPFVDRVEDPDLLADDLLPESFVRNGLAEPLFELHVLADLVRNVLDEVLGPEAQDHLQNPVENVSVQHYLEPREEEVLELAIVEAHEQQKVILHVLVLQIVEQNLQKLSVGEEHLGPDDPLGGQQLDSLQCYFQVEGVDGGGVVEDDVVEQLLDEDAVFDVQVVAGDEEVEGQDAPDHEVELAGHVEVQRVRVDLHAREQLFENVGGNVGQVGVEDEPQQFLGLGGGPLYVELNLRDFGAGSLQVRADLVGVVHLQVVFLVELLVHRHIVRVVFEEGAENQIVDFLDFFDH